jgi:transcriptional regulator with XRE-family HTH domain
MNDFNFLTTLGSRIKEIRTQKNITQQELAALCDFEKASMSRIESGQTNVSILTLKKICGALDVSMYEFFKDGSS